MTVGRKCRGCGQRIREGESRYAWREPEEYWHYKCAREHGAVTDPFSGFDKAREAIQGIKDAIRELRRRGQ